MKCIEPVFTDGVIKQLRTFGIQQAALCQDLWEAKPLGICRITTYVDPRTGFKSLDLTRRNGPGIMRTVTILTRENLKEML